jgi:type I restriction enzyme M protein
MNSFVSLAQTLCKPAQTLGLSCYDYLTEFSWLLFLRVAPLIDPVAYLSIHPVWETLLRKQDQQQYDYYCAMLTALSQANNPQLAGIYAQATTHLTQPSQLQQMISTLEVLNRFPTEDLGEIYETLLERCGQRENTYLIPPRSLVDLMVILLQPQTTELIYDPLAGTGSFLVACDQYMKAFSEEEPLPQHLSTTGMEPKLILQRLALMNCFLHDFRPLREVAVHQGDSLASPLSQQVDVLLGLLFSSAPNEIIQEEKTLMLLRQTLQILKPGGRAAVIVPDRVLQADGTSQRLRRELLDICNVHTVLRLPAGTFYPHTLATHVLFFQRGTHHLTENTQKTWFYDLRSHLPVFGKHLQLMRQHLLPFEVCYGDDPNGLAIRHEEGEQSRWRCFTREFLAEHEDKLDLCWLTPEKKLYADPISTNRTPHLMEDTLEELATIASLLH